jgi:hypothetical protein
MTKKELMRALVMRAIVDDYEPLDVATKDIQESGRQRDLEINQAQIIQELEELVAQGLASACAAPKGRLEEVQLSHYELDDLYFHLTEEGKLLIDQLLPSVWIDSDIDP